MKLVLPLDDPAADLATAGGKGASLARLARAGLPVPAGFHVTTEAYRAFVARPGRDRHRGSRTHRRRCSPAPTSRRRSAEDIRRAYAGLGDDVPVAVRSSATAEDLPDMSFAGPAGHVPQHPRRRRRAGRGPALLGVAVEPARGRLPRRSTASPHDDVALAVVVQELVPADAAGVLFTADPVTGARDEI